jgi:prepilin-type N-terminal cleavage/methylation domain-containing protein
MFTRHRRGFTFIEIVLVVVILMVLAALAMPQMKGTFASTRLKRTARNIAGLLRFARNTAVLRELPCEIRFDPDNDKYQVVLIDEEGKPMEPPSRRRRRRDETDSFTLGGDVVGVRTLPKKVHFAAIYSGAPLTEDTNRPRVIYYADGSATPATIAIQDEKGLAIRVEIFRTTGMARVARGLPIRPPKAQTLYYGPQR